MKMTRAGGTSRVAIFGVLAIYALVIILVLVFAGWIISDVSLKGQAANFVFWIFVIGLPVFLLLLVLLNVRNLVIARKNNIPGIRFRIRLVLFFAIVASFSSIPQMILSMTFVNGSLNNTFSTIQAQGMRAGQILASQTMKDKISLLKYSVDAANLANENFEGFWNQQIKTYPYLDSMEVFHEEQGTMFFAGRSMLRLGQGQDALIGSTDVSRENVGDLIVLRLSKIVKINGSEYKLVFSLTLPETYNQQIHSMSAALEQLSYFDKNSRYIFNLLYMFYGFFSLPLVLLAILASFMLSHEILRPLEDLEEGIVHIMGGDYSYRIHMNRDEGLGFLVNSFNQMSNELDFSRKMISQTEKISAWQEIAQQLAHEIKNPLTPIKLSAERILLKYKNQTEGWQNSIEPGIATIIKEVESLSLMLTHFKNFAQLPSAHLKIIPIAQLVRDAAAVLSSGYPQIEFDFKLLNDSIRILADASLIKQVFSNLFINSIEAMDNHGRIVVRTDLVKKGNTDYCRCQVSDNGSGISKENAEKVFSPYFTTKKKGTGLGLSFVDRIVVDHRGQIWFESETGFGTTFFIDLPIGERNE